MQKNAIRMQKKKKKKEGERTIAIIILTVLKKLLVRFVRIVSPNFLFPEKKIFVPKVPSDIGYTMVT